MRYARKPCGDCPWREDSPPGQFPAERYVALRSTSRRPGPFGGEDPQLTDPLFACHQSAEGKEIACAGWLAVEGGRHVTVRLALAAGDLPVCALDPGESWPALLGSYAELAERNGAPPDPGLPTPGLYAPPNVD